jgi:hypothetical protein
MSYSKPAGQDVLFEETFADVWRNAQRRRSAYLGSWIAQLFRPRNDADLRPAGDDVFRMREAGRNCDPAACVLLART